MFHKHDEVFSVRQLGSPSGLLLSPSDEGLDYLTARAFYWEEAAGTAYPSDPEAFALAKRQHLASEVLMRELYAREDQAPARLCFNLADIRLLANVILTEPHRLSTCSFKQRDRVFLAWLQAMERRLGTGTPDQ